MALRTASLRLGPDAAATQPWSFQTSAPQPLAHDTITSQSS